MSEVRELLIDSHIMTGISINEWEEAVKRACYPLEKERKITELYTENIIKSVNENGPYMVLTDYFALMHAAPGEGVNQLSMSLLVADQVVDMKGKAVKIFLILASPDSTSHIESLQSITEILMDETKFETILNGNKEEIINIL
ncbi:PTS sugar transporter subunit IIA [Enterococcus sp. LJL99]